ncbi:type VI secretion system protein ImpK [Luteibacter sp. Sphag1AF]|uniref:DotU family type IV/VI secretion system protein n=1 Tax=Luteibacter sp. Sphag1AF TaxID=2587031 RepID=UPI0016087F1F|nr:DotU family type IV/VI secretion system protein [Luteibacter sp. Sphag1AF]MBB3228075.1 type VI secretion system protein ImpK [Luteibacter sp. Sphag1AF]
MVTSIASPSFLLARFAAFYEEVAKIKLAAQSGDLVRLLQPDDPHAAIDAHQLAERVSTRLLGVLDRQSRDVVAAATEAELRAYRRARYVMVALADEIFILDLQWPGAEHWPEHMLEYAVERTRLAGRRFYEFVNDLMGVSERTVLDADLAAVLLIALQLGFQGMYRRHDGQENPRIRECRTRLYPLASGRRLGAEAARAFSQAYEYTVVVDRDNTRVALSPWLRGVAYGALIYLVLSSLVWLLLTWSLLDTIGGVK